MTISGSQVRAARAFLKWTRARLAKEAGVSAPTIQEIEKVDGKVGVDPGGLPATRGYRADAREESVAKIEASFTRAGVTFLPDNGKGPGVRRLLR